MQRNSKNRQAILDCLRGTVDHPSAEWIYRQLKPALPKISLATVYRNLIQLKEAGLIRSMGVVCGEERFDAAVMPHTHLVCSRCGAMSDFPGLELPKDLITQAEAQTGYAPDGVDLRFIGVCAACREKEKHGV